jgi:aldose 1-epimerase
VVKLELRLSGDVVGSPVDVVLGYNDLESYIEDDRYFGATVGRVANRIKEGVSLIENLRHERLELIRGM